MIIDGYNIQLTMLINQLEAFNSNVMVNIAVKRSIEQTIHKLNKKIELKMNEIVSDIYTQMMKLLRSIPVIGIKTAIYLMVLTGNFKKFDDYKQLIVYICIGTGIYQSGLSIPIRSYIETGEFKSFKNAIYV